MTTSVPANTTLLRSDLKKAGISHLLLTLLEATMKRR